MTALRSPGRAATLRARRWDVVVLGSALPGLVAAARLAQGGLRVLVVEEEAALHALPGWREPFVLLGARGGVLDSCLRELGLPPFERRELVREPLAFQVVFPGARVNVGDAANTAEELVSWGLLEPALARETLRVLVHVSSAERAAMLDAPVVRSGRLRTLAGHGVRRARGLPLEASRLPPELVPLVETQVRALSQLGAAPLPPEARARLYGAPFEGEVVAPVAGASLRGILRKRVGALHGEFAAVSRGFDLVQVGGCPGIAVDLSREVWVGRALLLNAPRAALASVVAQGDRPVPRLLAAPRPTHRRVVVALRARTRVIPEAMERRVICLREPDAAREGSNVVCIQRFPARSGGVDGLVATAVVPDDPPRVAEAEQVIEASVRELMPFSDDRLGRVKASPPRWDDDALVSDPGTGRGWPSDADIRLSARPPVYVLPREEVAALGTEGEILLGWRTGDAVRAQL